MRRFLLAATLVTMCFAIAPSSAGAFEPFQPDACGGKNQSSAACQARNSPNPIAGPNGVLLKVTNIIAYLAGAIAVIMIVVGGIRFITSGSDVSTGSRTDTDVEEARRTIASALVGLAVIILAKAIITYVIKRL
jgi:hypothetical protein